MSREDDTSTESQVTTDRESIERWADEHDAIPVRRERGGERVVDLVPESNRREHHEKLTWDDFHDELNRNEMVVIRRENESRPFDVLGRERMMSHHAVDADEVEAALLEGETVTTTITETTVIEETIVEEATVESEIVDRSVVDSTIVDAELISRDVDHCEVTNVTADDEDVDFGMFETGFQTDDEVEVEVEVDEGWTVTKELLEELTIESRIVKTDATETETVESDTIKETIDVEGVQQTILQGDMLDAETSASDVIDSGAIESRFREGEVIETKLFERSTVEEEMSVRKEFTGDLTAGSTTAAETISSQTIEREIATDEDVEFLDRETTGAATTAETESAAEMDAEAEMGGDHPMPTEAEEGKTVVDATGEEVGMVTSVESGTIYVDPHPSLTDRIKAVLDWGGPDDDAYPLESDHIATITDDEVQLTVDEDR